VAHALTPLLAGWESFYVIIGSSAAALTGLVFVVIVLGAEIGAGATTGTVGAFGTPTVVHFCAVLLDAAVLSAPWPGLRGPGIGIALLAVLGLAYTLEVFGRARRQTEYAPVLEDWIWHTILPLLAYTSLLCSGLLLSRHPEPCLFAVGGSVLLLLFIGIHNAWDAVLYIAVERRKKPQGE
jgi:hypothetical protein